jgi:hypothetical protein
MTADPQPPPESQLIAARRKAMDPEPSYRKAAREAGISPERWRQIETGVARVARGVDVPVRDVPAATIARMALFVRATPAELEACGRPDAARELATLLAARPERELSDAEMFADLSERIRWIEKQLGKPEDPKEHPNDEATRAG